MTVYRKVIDMPDGKQIEHISSEPFPPQDISYEPERVLASVITLSNGEHFVVYDESSEDAN